MHSLRSLIALAAPLALALVLPASAPAATLAPLKPCYVSVDETKREPVPVEASGFTPGSAVDVAIDGTPVKSEVPVLLDGTVSGSVSAPFQEKGQRRFTHHGDRAGAAGEHRLRRQQGHRAQPARTAEEGAAAQARALQRPRLHHRRADLRPLRVREKLRKTVDFGMPHGDCGVFRVKRRQIPVRNPRIGRWTLQADTEPEYSSAPASVFVRLAITVRRVFRDR